MLVEVWAFEPPVVFAPCAADPVEADDEVLVVAWAPPAPEFDPFWPDPPDPVEAVVEVFVDACAPPDPLPEVFPFELFTAADEEVVVEA